MYPRFKGHPWKPSLDPIHNHHQSKYHTSGLGFPKMFHTIHPSSLARTFEAKRKEDKVSPRCSYKRQDTGFPKKFQTWMPNAKHFMAKYMLLGWDFCRQLKAVLQSCENISTTHQTHYGPNRVLHLFCSLDWAGKWWLSPSKWCSCTVYT